MLLALSDESLSTIHRGLRKRLPVVADVTQRLADLETGAAPLAKYTVNLQKMRRTSVAR